jgi:polysaccharide pyruvyl transferase WcaK-like protein
MMMAERTRSTRTLSMKILVTSGLGSGIHAFGNMGDVAMLQSCLARLALLWPSAALTVLVDVPQDLSRFCPDASPLPTIGRNLLLGEDLLLGRFDRNIPKWFRRLAIKAKKGIGLHSPTVLKWFITARLYIRNRHDEINAISAFYDTLSETDLLIVSGAGGFSYSCRSWNMETLDTVEAAITRGIPVIMFGQQFGPLTDPVVLTRAKSLLPKVNLITLRGNPGARPLLESFGVLPSRVIVTGDEAIEMAYQARPANPGPHLGVNFRLAGSAETDLNDLEQLRSILHKFARDHHASLIPVPTSVDSHTCDQRPVASILQGFDDQSDGGGHLASPLEIMKQIGRCKVLVTCAYHAAVFALSQGIPVVALAKSPYYVEKFLGLKDMFGVGIDIVFLNRVNAMNSLGCVIDRAWESAPTVRIPLQNAALRQIELSWGAYNEARDLMGYV